MTLQTAEGEKQALCFSKSRRDMLLERHEKKVAVEITNHTFLKDGKICINDMTEISNAKQGDYFFQFKETMDANCRKTLSEIIQTSKSMDLVDISAKVVYMGDVEIVGEQKLRKAECVVADGPSSTMMMTVWQRNIAAITVGNAYTFTQIRVREKNDELVLNTSKDTVILPNSDQKLLAIKIDKKTEETMTNPSTGNKSFLMPMIHSIQDLAVFRQCANNKCNKKILQETSAFMVKCDHCNSRFRSSQCKENTMVNFTACDNNGDTIRLTAFKDILTALFGSVENRSSNELCELMLSLEDMHITYNSQMVVVRVEKQ